MPWKVLPLKEVSHQHIAAWKRLQAQSIFGTSPFTSYEFCQAVDTTRGGVYVSILEENSAVEAIFPFQRRFKSFPNIAEKVGGHMSDYFEVIGAAPRTFSKEELLTAGNLSVFCIDHMPIEGNQTPTNGGEITQGIKVELGNFANYLECLQNSERQFFKRVCRMSKQLEEAIGGPLTFSWNSDNPSRELSHLIKEKRKQYKETGAQDALGPSWTIHLLDHLICEKSEDLEALVSTLYCGDKWLASHLSLRYGRTLHSWFPVFNHEFRRFGSGHILFLNIFKTATALGISTIDFGAGDIQYKRKYLGIKYNLLKIALRRTNLVGISHRAAQSFFWRLKPITRQLRISKANSDHSESDPELTK